MQNEKNISNLSQEFIRKTKRRQSPKHKNQNLCHNKGQQKQNINVQQKEEFDLNQNPCSKNDSDVVIDLKNQLSQLKESMANVVHTKIESVRASNNTSPNKMLNYSFSDRNDKKNQLMKSNKSDDKEISKQKEMKKVKSKEKLKFSKVRKSDKFSPISSTKRNESQGNEKFIQDQPSIKDQERKRKKSGDESAMQQDIMRISQFHRKKFEQKMNTLVFNQVKKCIKKDVGRQRSISEAVIASLMKGDKKKESMKQKVEQQNEMQTMKTLLNEKSQVIRQYAINSQDSKAQISQLLTVKNRQQLQITALRNELAQKVEHNQTLENQTKRIKQSFIKLQQRHKKLKEQFQTISNELKSRELEIINLQKIIQNQNLDSQKTAINQLQIKQSPKKMSSFINGAAAITKTKQDATLTFSTPNSPRVVNRQKQLLNTIKTHEKSLQNYQKDLIFLQSECKNLHYFKMASKKLQTAIKETNHQLINQQLIKLNAKYEKKQLSFSPNKKEIARKGNKWRNQEK